MRRQVGPVHCTGIVPVLFFLLHLTGGEPEQEEVFRTDLLPNFDIRSVQRADRKGAVQGKLHVSRAGGLCARKGDLLGEIGSRDDLLREAHPVVGNENDFQGR